MNTRNIIACIIFASIVISGFLIWLIYFHRIPDDVSQAVGYLPALNASLNGLSAIALSCGLAFILKNNREVHTRFMTSAFIFSGLFLISYITYHHFHGDTPFPGTGAIRPVYFFVLISHIVLSIVALPLILITFYFSLVGRFVVHKKVARVTFPIWMYVSVTGVGVFLMQRLAVPIVVILFSQLFVGTPSAHARSASQYTPLLALCESRGVSWDWDSSARRIVLRKGTDKMVLALGFSGALINGSLRSLRSPVVLHQGSLLIPKSLANDAWWSRIPTEPVQVHRFDTVVIDAGHGGKDPGAIGRNGLKEKEVVLAIAKQVASILQRYGLKAVMTRSTDRFISLKGRTKLANENGADFFVSIHANASKKRRASGFEVYTLSEAVDDSARALASAENSVFKVDGREPDFFKGADPTLWDLIHTENRRESLEMADILIQKMSAGLPMKNRGMKTARFYVLRGAETPSVLIEVGFVTNSKEAELLGTRMYQQRVAQSISSGILAYKKRFESTNGFTN